MKKGVRSWIDSHKHPVAVLAAVLVVCVGGLLGSWWKASHSSVLAPSASSPSTDSTPPQTSEDSWSLVLVNRQHPKDEMSPATTSVEGVLVDSRIAENIKGFLAAARQIDPNEHLISGYRSVTYQETLYNGYVAQEMARREISQSEAEAIVQTYSQPAGSSEHQTGLAIDMSTVDSLNESDPQVVTRLKEIAPKYGFVLRFEADKTSSTGIGYEDWHWRYVGVANARYMTEHHLSLEEYVAKRGQSG